MARPRKMRTPDASDLSRLSADPDFNLEGGMRTLPVWVRHGNATYQPYIILWLDPGQRTIRGTNLVNPLATCDAGQTEALSSLIQACRGPFARPEFPFSFEQPAAERAVGPLNLDGLFADVATSPRPALPARIRVNDARLADAARPVFEPLGVAVEFVESLPNFDEMLTELANSMGGPQNEPPQPFTWDLDAAVLDPLFKAAAGYWRRKPWEYLDDYPPAVIQLGENGPRPDVPTLYASILGAAEEVFGVAFYYSAESLDRLVQRGADLLPAPEIEDAMLDGLAQVLEATGAPANQLSRNELRSLAGELMSAAGIGGADGTALPTASQMRALVEDSLALLFSPADESDPTYLDWLAAHNLKYPSKQGVPSFLVLEKDQEHGRSPNEREARALTLALEALSHFFRMYGRGLENGPAPFIAMQRLLGMPDSERPVLDAMPEVQLGDKRIRVPISYTFPTESLEAMEEEEELPPPSAAAATTLYRFHVTLEWKPDVWRRIEMRADQTLEDLHYAIQDAFGWDDDHLYSFYLNREAFDPKAEYCSPYADCGRHVSSYRLENVPLKPRKKLLYLFDYSDELRHTVTLEAIIADGVEKRKKYPRVTERHGRNVPQYQVW